MSIQVTNNSYAKLLKAQGHYVITVRDVDWYEYSSGFMIPAFLPHCAPQISAEMAKEVLKISGRAIARWDTNFGQIEDSQWWYVLKRGPWDIGDITSKKKRWMIRQGKKFFAMRPLSPGEVVSRCPPIAQLATARYEGHADIESREILEQRLNAAEKVPDVLEYIGCFHKDTLVSFSENYIQNNAVWLANIRHNPAFLNKYSSYGLMDGILHYYLNEKKMDYVLDGWRSIHHRTQFQDHLIRVFAFTKEYAIINIAYSTKLAIALALAYPFRNIIWALRNKWTNNTLDKISAVIKQESIRRSP